MFFCAVYEIMIKSSKQHMVLFSFSLIFDILKIYDLSFCWI